MPSRVRAHVTPLHVRNIIGHLSLHGYLREKKIEGNHSCIRELWKKLLHIRNI